MSNYEAPGPGTVTIVEHTKQDKDFLEWAASSKGYFEKGANFVKTPFRYNDTLEYAMELKGDTHRIYEFSKNRNRNQKKLVATYDARQGMKVTTQGSAHIRQLLKSYFAPAGYPNKRTAMALTPNWTTKSYREVCDHLRGVGSASMRIRKLVAAMDAHLKHAALIAPTIPRGLSLPSPVPLWRGVQLSPIMPAVPRVGETLESNGGCYTAFSFDRSVAERFAKPRGTDKPGFMFRLQSDRIARGTPWMWLLDAKRPGLPPRWKNVLGSTLKGEKEVLMPPGFLKVLSVSNTAGTPIVDVAYMPKPSYLRKGVRPEPNRQGRVVTKTVGGDRLEMKHPTLRINAATRKETARSFAIALAAKKLNRRRASTPVPTTPTTPASPWAAFQQRLAQTPQPSTPSPANPWLGFTQMLAQTPTPPPPKKASAKASARPPPLKKQKSFSFA